MTNTFQSTYRGRVIKNDVSVFLNGKAFHGFENLTISKSLDSICNSFSMELDDRFQVTKESWPLVPGTRIQIKIGKENVFTGRIEKLSTGFGASQRNYTISGRSLAGDLVDSSVRDKFEYTNIELDKLAEQLVAPFGLSVFLSVIPSKIDRFAIKPGETVFEALDRAARLQGFLWVSTRAGNIRLTRAARARSYSELHEDYNIISANLTIDATKRHNEYIVKGQTFGTDEFNGLNSSEPEGKAYDRGISRYRPIIVIAEGAVDTKGAQDRANWEASIRVAQGNQISIQTQGWTQEDGSLWGLNQIVRVKSSFLGLNKDLLTESITHMQSRDGGTITDISLIPVDSYAPQPIIPEEDDLLSQLGPF